MDFEIIGFMTVLYVVARLLHYWILTEEDSNRDGILVKIATVIMVGLWLFSLPVTVVFHVLNKWHEDRLIKIAKDEEWRDIKTKYYLTFKTYSSGPREYVCLARDDNTRSIQNSDSEDK